MSDPIDISLDGDDQLAEPPLVDFLTDDPRDGHFHVTFVPSDEVSTEPTESISIAKQSTDGARLSALLGEISSLCGSKLILASHLGGGDYTLHLDDKRIFTLADMDNAASVQVFDRLKQIADTAEIVFRIEHSPTPIHQQRRPAV